MGEDSPSERQKSMKSWINAAFLAGRLSQTLLRDLLSTNLIVIILPWLPKVEVIGSTPTLTKLISIGDFNRGFGAPAGI